MPGLKMRFGLTGQSVKGTPVIPGPVSSQTRSQTLLVLALFYCVQSCISGWLFVLADIIVQYR